MQIVIDIPKEYYNRCKDYVSANDADYIHIKIANGTPLPKGHGRLIDVDELIDKIQYSRYSSIRDVNITFFSIKEAPTIIKADMEEPEMDDVNNMLNGFKQFARGYWGNENLGNETEKKEIMNEGMTDKEKRSCVGTIRTLMSLAYSVHGVMDSVDANNCEQIIKLINSQPSKEDSDG